jgi:hypothetical protein
MPYAPHRQQVKAAFSKAGHSNCTLGSISSARGRIVRHTGEYAESLTLSAHLLFISDGIPIIETLHVRW